MGPLVRLSHPYLLLFHKVTAHLCSMSHYKASGNTSFSTSHRSPQCGQALKDGERCDLGCESTVAPSWGAARNQFGKVECKSPQYLYRDDTSTYPQAIESDHQNKSDVCFTRLLEYWLAQTPPPNMTDLLTALQSPSIGHRYTVSKVQALI